MVEFDTTEQAREGREKLLASGVLDRFKNMTAGLLAGVAASACVPAGDVSDFDTVVTQEGTCAQHAAPSLSDAHEYPRLRKRLLGC